MTMDWMTRTDAFLLAMAGFVAVMSLVRLMRKRHEEVVAGVRQQIAAHKKKPKKRSSTGDDQKRGAA